MRAWDRVCQNYNPLACVFPNWPNRLRPGTSTTYYVLHFSGFVKSSHSSSVSSPVGSRVVKKTVCRPSLMSSPPAKSPACTVEFTIERRRYDTNILCITVELLQWFNNSGSINLLLSDFGTDKQEIVVRVYVMLKSGFVASSMYITLPLRIWEIVHLRVRNHVVAQVTENTNKLLHHPIDYVVDVVQTSRFLRLSEQETLFWHYQQRDESTSSCQSGWILQTDNSSVCSIVAVASTYLIPQCLSWSRVTAQRL